MPSATENPRSSRSQATDRGVAWAADSSSIGSLSSSLASRSGLSKSPLASAMAVGAGIIRKLTQATDSGVAWAADSRSSSSF